MASILAPITDLDNLLTSWSSAGDPIYTSSEVTIDASAKTIALKQAGNLAPLGSGVTGQALYSFLKDRWKNENTNPLTKYDFPMLSITNEQFEFIDGWKPADNLTRKMLRNCGWAEVEADNTVSRRYSGIITLGTLGLTDQPYYTQVDPSATNVTGDWAATTAYSLDDVVKDAAGDGTWYFCTTAGTSDGTSFANDDGTAGTPIWRALTVDMDFTGPVNEAIQVFGDTAGGDAAAGDFDLTDYTKIFVRTRGKLYSDSDLADIGVTTMSYIVYRFPVSNATDLKITTSADTEIATGGTGTTADVDPYDDMTITYLSVNILGAVTDTTYALNDVVQEDNGAGSRWFKCTGAGTVTGSSGVAQGTWGGTATWTAFTEGEREVEAGTYSAYNVIINANDGPATAAVTKEIVYERSQYELRNPNTIDQNTSVNGTTANSLVNFVGDQLHTAAGVFIDDFDASDTNNVTFNDYAGVTHLYPLVVTLTLNFSSTLANDTDAEFYMYYTQVGNAVLVSANNYGDSDAVVVKDNVGSDISGAVTQAGAGQGSTMVFSYDFDGETGGGRDTYPGLSTDTPITVVAIGLNTGQYVKATGTITNTGATVSLVAPLERNFSDPV